MTSRVVWLRTSYWVGAIADALNVVAMVHPPLLQATLGLPDDEFSVVTRSALGMGASLMLGWTVLLIWADRKPLERRGVLLLTVCPVILGLALTTLYGVVTSYIPISRAISVWVFQVVLVALFLFSYFRSFSDR